jgi:hypothetical protein
VSYLARARFLLSEQLDRYVPEWKREAGFSLLFDMYLALTLTVGVSCTLKQVHDVWAIAEEWDNPQHPSIIEFASLSSQTAERDIPFRDAIRETARILLRERIEAAIWSTREHRVGIAFAVPEDARQAHLTALAEAVCAVVINE